MNNEETALATVAPAVLAPTRQSPQQLARRLSQMKEERGLVATFFKDVMVDGEDYGTVPGVDRPMLFKPGAEKLAELYGFHPVVKARDEITDYDTGFYRCVITMALVNDAGQVVGEGVGECNTREARYFYRWVKSGDVPAGLDTSGLKSRAGVRWVFTSDLPAGTDKSKLRTAERTSKAGKKYTVYAVEDVDYRLENDDLFTLWNTVLKMAKKRAFVDVTLSVTRSSSVFSKSSKGITDWIDAEYTDVSDLGKDVDDDDPPAPITPEGEKPADPPPSATAEASATVEGTLMASAAQVKALEENGKRLMLLPAQVIVMAKEEFELAELESLTNLTSHQASALLERQAGLLKAKGKTAVTA